MKTAAADKINTSTSNCTIPEHGRSSCKCRRISAAYSRTCRQKRHVWPSRTFHLLLRTFWPSSADSRSLNICCWSLLPPSERDCSACLSLYHSASSWSRPANHCADVWYESASPTWFHDGEKHVQTFCSGTDLLRDTRFGGRGWGWSWGFLFYF